MEEAKPPDPLANSEVFRYARFACRTADGAIKMGVSIYGGIAMHASGELTVEPERDDYDFWLWLVLREREQDVKCPFLNKAEVQQAREEYAQQTEFRGGPLRDRAEVEILPLVKPPSPEDERQMERMMRETNPLNPLNWLRLLGEVIAERIHGWKRRRQIKGPK